MAKPETSDPDRIATILTTEKDPTKLETLYRQDSNQFAQALTKALTEQPDNILLQAWQARLSYSPDKPLAAKPNQSVRDLFIALALALLATLFAKLPHFLQSIEEEQFYPQNLPAIGATIFVFFFAAQRQLSSARLFTLSTVLLVFLIHLNLLPSPNESDTTILAFLHAPFLYWSLIGIAFMRGKFRDLPGRMNYLRYSGELLIFTTLIMIGGGVFTGISLGLFSLLELHIEEWYMRNVGLYGTLAAPLVATVLITRVTSHRFRLAPLIAKVFTPLFLMLVSAYLLTMLVNQKSPFSDRDFLIMFNVLLLFVLGMGILSISERGAEKNMSVFDYLNIGLVTLTLVVDIVALAAILFRLSSYGFTPNRVAVLGANLLAFGHLAGILYYYACFAKQRATLEDLETWIVRYLPLYNAWGLVVIFGLPLLFRFA